MTTPDTARREAIKRIVAKTFLVGECSDEMCDARVLHLGIADGRKLEAVADAILAKESQALGEALARVKGLEAALKRIPPHTKWPTPSTIYDLRARLDHIGGIARAALTSAGSTRP